MKEVKNGWLAQSKGGRTFEVEDGQNAAGIYVELTRGSTRFYFAGVEGDANNGMELPADPSLLRDLAKTLNKAAKALEVTEYPYVHPFSYRR